jgi:hypothetical protein
MSKIDFQQYICRPFCDFYKPGAKEELLCRGALLVERLVRQGRLHPGDFGDLRRDLPFPAGPETDLETAVCTGCPFENEDCDFRSLPPPEDARPCGGLLLLEQLRNKGRLSLEDLEEVQN